MLSAREKLLIAAALLAVVLFVAIRQLVFPKIDDYRKIRTAIPRRLTEISRFAIAAEGESRVDERLAERGALLYELESRMLPGDSPAAAGAGLQGMLKPWIERSKMRLISLRALPPAPKGPYSEIAVQADLQGTTEGLTTFLAEIARQKKMLRVRKLGITSGMYSMAMVSRPELLTVTVEIAGMTDGGAEGKPEEEGR
jgi:hypothetical protein